MLLSFIPAPTIKINSATRVDLDQFIVGGIYLPASGNSYVRVFKVNKDFSNAGELLFSEGAGKDDSVTFSIRNDGSVIVIISEALGATGSGNTSEPNAYVIPNVFPAYIPITIDQIARNLATGAQNTANATKTGLLNLQIELTAFMQRISSEFHL